MDFTDPGSGELPNPHPTLINSSTASTASVVPAATNAIPPAVSPLPTSLLEQPGWYEELSQFSELLSKLISSVNEIPGLFSEKMRSGTIDGVTAQLEQIKEDVPNLRMCVGSSKIPLDKDDVEKHIRTFLYGLNELARFLKLLDGPANKDILETCLVMETVLKKIYMIYIKPLIENETDNAQEGQMDDQELGNQKIDARPAKKRRFSDVCRVSQEDQKKLMKYPKNTDFNKDGSGPSSSAVKQVRSARDGNTPQKRPQASCKENVVSEQAEPSKMELGQEDFHFEDFGFNHFGIGEEQSVSGSRTDVGVTSAALKRSLRRRPVTNGDEVGRPKTSDFEQMDLDDDERDEMPEQQMTYDRQATIEKCNRQFAGKCILSIQKCIGENFLPGVRKFIMEQSGLKEEHSPDNRIPLCSELIVDGGNYRGTNAFYDSIYKVKAAINQEKKKGGRPRKYGGASGTRAEKTESNAVEETEECSGSRRPKEGKKLKFHQNQNLRLRLATREYENIGDGAEEIAELAKKSVEVNKMLLYEDTEAKLPLGNQWLVKREIDNAEENLNYYAEGLYVPVVKYAELLKPGNDYEKLITSVPVCIVEGMFDKQKNPDQTIKKEIFSLETLAAINEDAEVDVYEQIPQQEDSNINFENGKQVRQVKHKKLEWTVSEYLNYLRKLQTVSRNAFKKLNVNNPRTEDFHQAVELIVNLHYVGMENAKEARLLFCTNFDLVKESYKAVYDELMKLPEFLRPGQDVGLMQFVALVLGVNSVQEYFKSPFSRTAGHFENSAFDSVNLNLGDDDCVWFTVPLEYSNDMAKLLKDKKGPTIFNSNWPNAEDLKKNGIPMLKFVQKPGDLVYVGTGTYHYVQSRGFAGNVSWNVAQPTLQQLQAIAVFHDFTSDNYAEVVVPVIEMFTNMARAKAFCSDPDPARFDFVKAILKRILFWLETVQIRFKDYFGGEPAKFAGEMKPQHKCCFNQCWRELLMCYAVRNSNEGGTLQHCVAHMNKRTDKWYITHDIEYYRNLYKEYVHVGPQ